MKRSDLFLIATLLLGIWIVLALASSPRRKSAYADLLETQERELGAPFADDADLAFSGPRSL